jgi:hypothetical protein
VQVQTSIYRVADGWSTPLPAALDDSRTLVLAFGARQFDGDLTPFDDLLRAFPRAVIAGCSTAGEMSGGEVLDDSVSVAVARFEHTRLRVAAIEVSLPEESAAAGRQLAESLAGEGLRAVFLLSDGLAVNGTPLVAGLVEHLPADVSVTGGLAGDGSRFAHTWVLVDGKPRNGHVTAVGFYGDRLRVSRGCEGGWMDFGPERRITRSSGNTLYELDGKPALDLYKTYLGKLASGLPGTALRFPLSIQRPHATALVRTVLSIDEAGKSMTFAGDVPQESAARLMFSIDDNLISSAIASATDAMAGLSPSTPVLAVSVSGVGRRLVLGERIEEEVEPIMDSLPAGAAHVGFYSCGEISSTTGSPVTELHNQTMTITVFAES